MIDSSSPTPTPTSTQEDRTFDSPWKDVLEIFFKDFLTFAFSAIADEIDWQQAPVFLDKELQAVTKGAATGQRTVDKLVKVFKKSGSEVWMLIHIEVQAQKKPHFAERMYVYHYRLFDRYRVPVVNIAILLDTDSRWLPTTYQSALWGTSLHFRYEVIKVLAYQSEQASLEASTNPFATVMLAQLVAMTLAKERDVEQRLVSKMALTRLLYDKGWGRDYVWNLFRFIDWVIQLPIDLVIKYDEMIHQLSEEKKMTYITSIERLAMERGHQKGRLEGEEKGKLEGRVAGKLEGKLEGKEEGVLEGQRKTQLAIAKQLLAKGQDAGFVIEITGLTLADIETLQSDMTHQ